MASPKKHEQIHDDTIEESQTDYGLFKAYRQGQLDLNILSTQEVAPVMVASCSNSSSFQRSDDPQPIPKSWCVPPPNAIEKKITLGNLCKKQSLSINPISDSPSDLITRVPVTNSNILSDPKIIQSAINAGRSNAILVNQRQRGNPVLKHIRNVAWEYSDIEPDYVVGRNNCVYFLSLRYHNLNPEYIFERLRQTKQTYQLSVLLAHVDIPDPYYPLKELCKYCLTEGLTLMLAWTLEEAARYLESYKALENKPPDNLMPELASSLNFSTQVSDFLTSVRRITKTDAVTAMSHFETVADIIRADQSKLEACPGFGQLKARKLHDVFHMPFVRETN